MLHAVFTAGVDEIEVSGLTQWDRGQMLSISCPGLPSIYQVHFTYKGAKTALMVHVLDDNTAEIPDELLHQPRDLVAYVYLIGEDGSGETVKTINLPLVPRAKPEDYTADLTPTQMERIEAMLAEINLKAEDAVSTSRSADGKADNAVATANRAEENSAAAERSAAAAQQAASNAVDEAARATAASQQAEQQAAAVVEVANEASQKAEDAEAKVEMVGTEEDLAALAALLGLGSDASIVEVLESVKGIADQAVAAGVKIKVGSYVGTGTSGSANPTSLTFDFAPKMLMMLGEYHWQDRYKSTINVAALTTSYVVQIFGYTGAINTGYCKKSADGKTISWYANYSSSKDPGYQFNQSGTTYEYIAIG